MKNKNWAFYLPENAELLSREQLRNVTGGVRVASIGLCGDNCHSKGDCVDVRCPSCVVTNVAPGVNKAVCVGPVKGD